MKLAAFLVCVAKGHAWKESRWPGWQTCRRCYLRRLEPSEPEATGADRAEAAPTVRRAAASSLPTIVMATRKGGTGKTTLAVHLALAAHLRGLKVVLADADPQHSATEALRGRDGDAPSLLDTSVLGLSEIKAHAERLEADVLVIDTPGGRGATLAEALALADVALLIARPTFLDIAAAVRTQAEARAIGAPSVIVLNQAPPMRAGQENAAVESVLEALRTNKLPVATAIVRSRTVFQTSVATGRSVEELGASPAAAEVAALWDAVQALLADSRDDDAAGARPAWLRPAPAPEARHRRDDPTPVKTERTTEKVSE
jgi:chromosome partitioning protein